MLLSMAMRVAKMTMALNAILPVMPPKMIRTLAVKENGKDVCEAIRFMYMCTNRTRKSTIPRLRREWELLFFCYAEHVNGFMLHLIGLMSSLSIHGKSIDKQRAAEKLLRFIPSKYTQLAP